MSFSENLSLAAVVEKASLQSSIRAEFLGLIQYLVMGDLLPVCLCVRCRGLTSY